MNINSVIKLELDDKSIITLTRSQANQLYELLRKELDKSLAPNTYEYKGIFLNRKPEIPLYTCK